MVLSATSCIAVVDNPNPLGNGPGAPGEGTGGSPAVIGAGTGGTGAGSIIGSGGEIGSGGAPGSGGAAFGSGGRAAVDGGISDGSGSGSGGVRADAGTGTGGISGTGGATVAAVCTSKTTWSGSTGPDMRPGNTCPSCHSFTIAGTIYPTAHEPTNCNGVNGSTGARVVITGADGRTLTLTPTAAGNFYSSTAVAKPFTARVTSTAATRMMLAAQSTGDCNSCHTQNGANGAPGRIMVP